MNKELKAKIDDIEATETALMDLGAKFVDESTFFYTYFRQPPGKVLKLTMHDEKVYKTVIEKTGDKFVIKENSLIENPDTLERDLTSKYGIKRKLVNRRRFYAYGHGDSIISINQIEEVGNFLIIESENPDALLLQKLGISQVNIVTDSFDNL